MTELIDLSQEIYTDQPVYHMLSDTVISTDTSHEEAEDQLRKTLSGENPPFTFETKRIKICDHGPTHVDAIRHFKQTGTPINEMPLETFYTPGKAIDVSHRGAGEYITKDDLKSACKEANVTIEEGDTVLIRTGHYDENYPTDDYVENYPGLNEEATRWLFDQGIVNFGVDSPSPDTPSDPTYPCHTLCREHEIPHVENLRNINEVVGKDFTYIGFPLAIRDGTGSPIRPVAVLED